MLPRAGTLKVNENPYGQDEQLKAHYTARTLPEESVMNRRSTVTFTDVNARTHFGETPMRWAAIYFDDHIIQLLKEHGGK